VFFAAAVAVGVEDDVVASVVAAVFYVVITAMLQGSC